MAGQGVEGCGLSGSAPLVRFWCGRSRFWTTSATQVVRRCSGTISSTDSGGLAGRAPDLCRSSVVEASDRHERRLRCPVSPDLSGSQRGIGSIFARPGPRSTQARDAWARCRVRRASPGIPGRPKLPTNQKRQESRGRTRQKVKPGTNRPAPSPGQPWVDERRRRSEANATHGATKGASPDRADGSRPRCASDGPAVRRGPRPGQAEAAASMVSVMTWRRSPPQGRGMRTGTSTPAST